MWKVWIALTAFESGQGKHWELCGLIEVEGGNHLWKEVRVSAEYYPVLVNL